MQWYSVKFICYACHWHLPRRWEWNGCKDTTVKNVQISSKHQCFPLVVRRKPRQPVQQELLWYRHTTASWTHHWRSFSIKLSQNEMIYTKCWNMGMPGSESVPSGVGKQNLVKRATNKIKYSKNLSTFWQMCLRHSLHFRSFDYEIRGSLTQWK